MRELSFHVLNHSPSCETEHKPDAQLVQHVVFSRWKCGKRTAWSAKSGIVVEHQLSVSHLAKTSCPRTYNSQLPFADVMLVLTMWSQLDLMWHFVGVFRSEQRFPHASQVVHIGEMCLLTAFSNPQIEEILKLRPTLIKYDALLSTKPFFEGRMRPAWNYRELGSLIPTQTLWGAPSSSITSTSTYYVILGVYFGDGI